MLPIVLTACLVSPPPQMIFRPNKAAPSVVYTDNMTDTRQEELEIEKVRKQLRSMEPSTEGDKARKASNDKVIALLEKADKMELYRLDPKKPEKPGADTFHEFPVVLRAVVAWPHLQKELATTLGKELHWNSGWKAACFLPRHGLRATVGKDTYDFVICFQCNKMQVYKGDEYQCEIVLIGPKWEAADKLLQEAEQKKDTPKK